jgi:hypothetical protein
MRIAIVFLVAAALVFAATTEHHSFTLGQTYSASGAILTPGSYKVVIDGNHATLMRGSEEVLTSIKVETSASEYRLTAMKSSEGKTPSTQSILTEIDLGGTHKKLVFD